MFYTDEIRQIIEQTKKTITLEDVKNGDCFVHSNRKIYRVVYDKEKQDKLVLTYEPKKDGSYVLKKLKRQTLPIITAMIVIMQLFTTTGSRSMKAVMV